MAKNQNTFEKRRREIEKKHKAELKRRRRREKKEQPDEPEPAVDDTPEDMDNAETDD